MEADVQILSADSFPIQATFRNEEPLKTGGALKTGEGRENEEMAEIVEIIPIREHEARKR